MKAYVFTGVGTALITPFRDGKVDGDAFRRLIEFQIAGGVSALVVAGTTGESAVLSGEEFQRLLAIALETAGGRVPVIAGTGANDTARAIEKTKTACAMGADAVLLVTPYYNKTTQKGLIASFSAIADASSVPCVLYNVPSRTGLNMLPETLAVLAKHERIAAVKEACGNISQVAKERLLCGDDLDVYSGCDDQTVPTLSLGGKGLVSVVANILPKETAEICTRFFSGDVQGAAALQLKLLPLMNQLMIETNPIPAKAACAAIGFGQNLLRLPLVPMEDDNRQKLLTLMREAGLEVKE